MIELANLRKTYDKTLAVDDLSLTVEKGEVFGFIGPNGAGKTTTIKMMGGVIAPTSGSVRICGISMEKDPMEAKRKIGFIPDRPFLYEKLSGMEFMRFTADLYGSTNGNFYEKASRNLELFSLLDRADELIEGYSHGMKQRLIMASALLHEPEVLIVDEPMVGLDPAAIRLVKDLLRRLASNGVSIFMSTHTLEVAEDVCDRIGVIHKGRLIATGTPTELKRETGIAEADLEKVFIRLTQERSSAPAAAFS